MAYPEAAIFLLYENGMRGVACKDTEHFRVMRDFLNHRAAMLCELMR
ncbi:MAG TPA: hypothetical protein VNH18_10355 [Bryobacteraceae bacterium]|nr:hypothetical protein [Bryobacteraceae bacterium]